MMIMGKQNILVSFRLFSAISLAFLCLIFFRILSYDNTKSSMISELELKHENKFSCFNNAQSKNLFWNQQKTEICNDIKADFGFLYSLSESRYIYYSFALFLGGVINVNKIIKVGVF